MSRRSAIAGALGVLVCALIVYWPAIGGAFVFDDITLPFSAPGAATRPFLEWLGVRPLLMFTYWLNYRFFGLATFSYHFVNVLLHAANSILVFLIVRRILAWAKRPSDIPAAFAGALFLLHPLATEAVSYVSGRSETLSAFFFLSAFAIFLYRRSREVTWRVSIAILILFAAALNTKEHTATLPAVLLLTDYYWHASIQRNWRLYVPIAITGVAGVALLLRYLSQAKTVGFHIAGLPWHAYFFTQWRALATYARLFVFPAGQNVDYDYPVSRSPLEHGAIFALLAIAAAVYAAIRYGRRFPVASYGFFLSLILFAPTSSVIPIADVFAERRMYLPMVGLVLIVAGLVRNERRVAALAAVCLLAAAILTYRRNGVWVDAIALEQDAASKAPGNPRPHEALALAYFYEGRCAEAVEQDEQIARLSKPSYKLYLNWGVDLECNNQFDQALEKLGKAATIERTAHVYASIGKVLSRQGRWAEAFAALETAARIDPRFSWTYVYRGSIRQRLGQLEAAKADYRLALSCDPNNPNARELLEGLERGR